MTKTLFVIIRRTENGKKYFTGGTLVYSCYIINNVEEINQYSMFFTKNRDFSNINQIPKPDAFLSLKEYREKIDYTLDPKFSQKILSVFGFDRIWIYDKSLMEGYSI